MAKKDRGQVQQVVQQPEPIEVNVSTEALLEADAYGTPQPDLGADVTVMKQVGVGGPVPIVAPKHTTIQLQPIIVPLAVVPYMTQDSNVLRTDNRQQASYVTGASMEDVEITDFTTVDRPEGRRARALKLPSRIFALILLLLSAVTVMPFIISHYSPTFAGSENMPIDLIAIVSGWIQSGFNFYPLSSLIFLIVACIVGVNAIMALIGLIVGKFPRLFSCIVMFLSTLILIGVLIWKIVTKEFVVADNVIYIVIMALSAFTFLVSVIFSIILNHIEDRDDERGKSKVGKEI